MNFSNMTLHLNHENIFFLYRARKNRILTVIFNPNTTFSFFFFFFGGLLASFEKEF